VGQASARRLASLSGQDILFPTSGSDSEALLALPQLADVTGQHWLIVRAWVAAPCWPIPCARAAPL
jgi:uroporphyrinogen-III synthase